MGFDEVSGQAERAATHHAAQIQEEVQEFAEVLLREQPPGTQITEVWEGAISLRRVRYETEGSPPRGDWGGT